MDISQKRFVVSIYEIQQELVFAEEFTGRYVKDLKLSDGTSRTVELTALMRDGRPTIELVDTGSRHYMGLVPVRTGAQTNGSLMVRIHDLDDVDAARAEWRANLPVSPVLPPETSLASIPEFVPPGFRQGIEILNDNTTPMNFVATVLNTHAHLSLEDSHKTMLAIHRRGGALIPTTSFAEAERIATQITAEAAKDSHPLICRPVSIVP